MGEEAVRSPEKRREGNIKLSITSWRAHVALFPYNSNPSVVFRITFLHATIVGGQVSAI